MKKLIVEINASTNKSVRDALRNLDSYLFRQSPKEFALNESTNKYTTTANMDDIPDANMEGVPNVDSD